MWRKGAFGAALAAGVLCFGVSGAWAQHPKTTPLYADPAHADLSGLWMSAGDLRFAPGGALPTFKPPYDALYAKRQKAWDAGAPVDDVTADCLPPGMPHIQITPYPFEVMQTPGRVTILYEYAGQVRRIFTDGTKAPDGFEPTYYGFSVGRWEGDTLVVTTTHIREDTQVDYMGMPHSGDLTITERFRRKDAETLEDEITLTDPTAYTAPFTSMRIYKLKPTWTIGEYVCEQNNRNRIGADGVTGSGVPTKGAP